MTEREINALCDRVRQTAYAIHLYLGNGHLEKVYENALAHRLRKAGMSVQQQCPLSVYDEDGTPLGEYFADLLVEGILVIETKAAKSLAIEHESQILGYLKSAKVEHGLLMNFGAPKFQIRKFAWSRVRTINRSTRAIIRRSNLRTLRFLRLISQISISTITGA